MTNQVYDNTKLLCRALENDYKESYKDSNLQYNYTIEEGNKYLKVIMNTGNQLSVHCFVDMITGDLYKAASWKAPAKGIRGNLITELNEILHRCDWNGSYLYK